MCLHEIGGVYVHLSPPIRPPLTSSTTNLHFYKSVTISDQSTWQFMTVLVLFIDLNKVHCVSKPWNALYSCMKRKFSIFSLYLGQLVDQFSVVNITPLACLISLTRPCHVYKLLKYKTIFCSNNKKYNKNKCSLYDKQYKCIWNN